LDENAIEVLVKYGLQDRFPVECNTWVERKQETHRNKEAEIKKKEISFKEKLAGESAQLEEVLRGAIVDKMVTTFPYVVFWASTIPD
jgi:hypothetical protein